MEIRLGWMCPRCKTVMSPYALKCTCMEEVVRNAFNSQPFIRKECVTCEYRVELNGINICDLKGPCKYGS